MRRILAIILLALCAMSLWAKKEEEPIESLKQRAEAAERVHEHALLSGATSDDDAGHARRDEAADGVLGERVARDRHKRLRQPLCRLAHALRLAARKEQADAVMKKVYGVREKDEDE